MLIAHEDNRALTVLYFPFRLHGPLDGLRQAVGRTGERLSAVELAHDAEAYLRRIQEFARNISQAKQTANLQHDIEPALRPTVEQEQDWDISI